MQLIKRTMIFSGLIASLGFLGSFAAYAEINTPKAVDKVEVDKYVGKWYEIAHFPMYFQRKCVSDTTANYSINYDKTIAVINSCRTKTGETISSEGIAYPQNEGNSMLKVSFLPSGLRWIPFTKGDYWVLRVDSDYRVALVGGPSHKYLWILSREPNLDAATYQSYVQTAHDYGYDTSKLVRTPQKQ
ncbi:lipocalin family protein [Acinetobacter sp. ANC 5442]|nr:MULTISPECIES: lipocalin family protein [Acinetobacter]MCH7294445.1 lipocalin family protein [Acinetobacter higginsii]QHH97783.1 lipocalin family protein [Acinetobacter dispersus]